MSETNQTTSNTATERPASFSGSFAEKIDYVRNNSWWSRLDDLDSDFGEKFFSSSVPIEQLVIGHDDKSVRFYNFGNRPMSDEKIADCERFIDTISQLFGDKAYEYVTDIVIAPMKHSREDVESGKVYRNFEGIIFLDSELLGSEGSDFEGNENGLDVSKFLYVLTHEFGHVLDGNGYENATALLEYAKKAGWNTELLETSSPLWSLGMGEAFRFAPEYGITIRHNDGSTKKMSQEAYIDKYGQPYDRDGKFLENIQLTGSPADYAEVNPKESYAETTADMLLGSFVMDLMPNVRDAWLDHAGTRGPLATPVKRSPLTTIRNTGNSITYPDRLQKI